MAWPGRVQAPRTSQEEPAAPPSLRALPSMRPRLCGPTAFSVRGGRLQAALRPKPPATAPHSPLSGEKSESLPLPYLHLTRLTEVVGTGAKASASVWPVGAGPALGSATPRPLSLCSSGVRPAGHPHLLSYRTLSPCQKSKYFLITVG